MLLTPKYDYQINLYNNRLNEFTLVKSLSYKPLAVYFNLVFCLNNFLVISKDKFTMWQFKTFIQNSDL